MNRMATPSRSRGLVLMGLMVLLALIGLVAVPIAESAATAHKRMLENDLLWVGEQYRAALESYYRASPGRLKHLPVSLDELVLDPRFPQPVRHLRQLYADPTQPEIPWGLLRQGNQIIGVYSQSDARTLRRTGFPPGLEDFEGTTQYAEWRFLFVPRAAGAANTAHVPATLSSPTTSKP